MRDVWGIRVLKETMASVPVTVRPLRVPQDLPVFLALWGSEVHMVNLDCRDLKDQRGTWVRWVTLVFLDLRD